MMNTPLNIINWTPFGCPDQCLRATLPVNQLYQAPIFDGRPDSNVHRCKIHAADEPIIAREIVPEAVHVSRLHHGNDIIVSSNMNILTVEATHSFNPYVLRDCGRTNIYLFCIFIIFCIMLYFGIRYTVGI